MRARCDAMRCDAIRFCKCYFEKCFIERNLKQKVRRYDVEVTSLDDIIQPTGGLLRQPTARERTAPIAKWRQAGRLRYLINVNQMRNN